MTDWVVAQALDRVVVRVLENALQTSGPNDHTLVSAPRCKSFAVPENGESVWK